MALTNSPKTGALVNGDIGEEHYDALMRLWRVIDMLIQPTCKAMSGPPSTPADGDIYVVTTATGAFAGKMNNIARWNALGNIYDFVPPKEGWWIWNETTNAYYFYDGDSWEPYTPDNPLPTGGTTGQVLAKNSGTDHDVEWVDPATAASESVIIQIALSDLDTALATKTIAAYVRSPKAFTLNEVRASLLTASSSGAVTVGIKASGTTVLSTNLTIDASENTSETAATPAVISDSSIADDEELRFEIIGAGTGAKGLIVTLLGTV